MKKVLKWIGIVLGGLLGLLVVLLVGFGVYANLNFKPTNISANLMPIAADQSEAGIQRGEYLVKSVMACADCHGVEFGKEPLAGRVEHVELGPIQASLAFPNLTSDMETGLGGWTDAEIARAIREGVDKDGVKLIFMPAGNYNVLSDRDVAAIVGYLRTLEPVRNELPPMSANAAGKMVFASGAMPLPPAGKPLSGPVEAPPEGTVAYGGYLVSLAGCRDCHGENLSGGQVPGSAPGDPATPNLVAGGFVSTWTEAQFIQTFRTGVNPVNRPLNKEIMPIEAYGKMHDSDLQAIYQYLQSLK